MLTNRYMTSTKNLPAIMQKIVEGTAPDKFTVTHLKGIGFKSSNDQGIIPVLKDLKFLTEDGSPTKRYHDYRDKSQSRVVLGESLGEAYEDLFHIKEHPSESDRQTIIGRFKSVHNTSDAVAERQALTFLSLLKLADVSGGKKPPRKTAAVESEEKERDTSGSGGAPVLPFAGLRYNIEIHLPATKDIEVYNSIFKSLKEHLLEP